MTSSNNIIIEWTGREMLKLLAASVASESVPLSGKYGENVLATMSGLPDSAEIDVDAAEADAVGDERCGIGETLLGRVEMFLISDFVVLGFGFIHLFLFDVGVGGKRSYNNSN